MHNHTFKIIFFVLLFFVGSFSAFIQSPIPPSSDKNYFRDTNGDGHLDQIEIYFLGNLSHKYILEMLDSLTFEWIDSDGGVEHYSVNKGEFILDSLNKRILKIDLKKIENQFRVLTALSTTENTSLVYGSALLYQKDGSVYPIQFKDGMAPSIISAQLKNMQGTSKDTLSVLFSEDIQWVSSCGNFLEYKSFKDKNTYKLKSLDFIWNTWKNSVKIVIENNFENRLSYKDSIRIVSNCVEDLNGNFVKENSLYVPITGYSPFVFFVPGIGVDDYSSKIMRPVFQLNFDPVSHEVQRDSAWGVYMNVLGEEFDNFLREKIKLKNIDYSKLKIKIDIRIYTNLGAYVVGTSAYIGGDDKRFTEEPTRLSLLWNYLDVHGRRVSTGAYLANISIIVEYDGKIIYGKGAESKTSHIFGVKHR